jgi:tyrosyl-tRNA synthetase
MDSSKETTLTWAVAEIIESASLTRRLKENKKLIIKLGIDPTSRELHKAVLVIGDFTGLIGDPSGVNVTRPALTKEQVKDNMSTYMEQAGCILDLKKAEIVYNSKWLSKINLANFIDIASKVSLNGLVEREDFAKRLDSGKQVALHELIYAVAMAIDSVELKSDVELGGWDQTKPTSRERVAKKVRSNPSRSSDNEAADWIGWGEKDEQQFRKLHRPNRFERSDVWQSNEYTRLDDCSLRRVGSSDGNGG